MNRRNCRLSCELLPIFSIVRAKKQTGFPGCHALKACCHVSILDATMLVAQFLAVHRHIARLFNNFPIGEFDF